MCNRIRLLLLTGSTDDIPLSGSVSVAEDGSIHSTEVMKSNDTDEDFMQFVTSELSIDIAEHTLIPTTLNNDTDEAELLRPEDLAQSASDNDVPQDVYKRQACSRLQCLISA